MDMLTKTGNLHLEIQTSRKSPVGILRTSFYEGGKTKHTQHGRITGCSLSQLKMLQLALREKVIPENSPQAFQIMESKEYGASKALYELSLELGLDKILYSRPEPWVNCALAMIIGRIVYAGSKLSLCHQQHNTALWEVCGVHDFIDVDKHCYLPMDRLLERQKLIQKKLAQTHLKNGHLVLYDITSSYLEGEYDQSDLVDYGYNRDGKKGHAQIVIGLICNDEGCPVGVEVFRGNTKDSTTVLDKIEEIRVLYGIQTVTFVGDRGMLTKHNLMNLQEEQEQGLDIITALTHQDIQKLLEQDLIQPELFDDLNVCEVIDPENPKKRYCLCRNPVRAKKDQETRMRLLELTESELEKIAHYKQATTVEILGSRIGKILNKYKTGKYINWEIKADQASLKSQEHQVMWCRNEEKLRKETLLEGCYVITTTAPAEKMSSEEIVASYKSLILVEKAFRNLKTVQLEIRPIYHKKDDRIRSHAFLCMLAYYVQWHMQRRVASLADEEEGKNRRWSFYNIIETLKQITQNKVSVEGIEFYKVSQPTYDQKRICDMMEIKI